MRYLRKIPHKWQKKFNELLKQNTKLQEHQGPKANGDNHILSMLHAELLPMPSSERSKLQNKDAISQSNSKTKPIYTLHEHMPTQGRVIRT